MGLLGHGASPTTVPVNGMMSSYALFTTIVPFALGSSRTGCRHVVMRPNEVGGGRLTGLISGSIARQGQRQSRPSLLNFKKSLRFMLLIIILPPQ